MKYNLVYILIFISNISQAQLNVQSITLSEFDGNSYNATESIRLVSPFRKVISSSQDEWFVRFSNNTSARISLTSNVNEVSESSGIKVFPNPSKDQILVNRIEGGPIKTIMITNMKGEIFYESESLANQMLIDISGMNQGIYIITVSTQEQQLIKKLIIE